MDALKTLSQASDMVVHSDTTSLASSMNTASQSGKQQRTYSLDGGPDQYMIRSIGITDYVDLDDIGPRSPGTESVSTSTKIAAEFHLREVEEQLQNIFTPTPMELFRVTLYKIRAHGGFGFCLSDGVYEKGVYVSAIQPSGPAERSGVLKTYDRILQVCTFTFGGKITLYCQFSNIYLDPYIYIHTTLIFNYYPQLTVNYCLRHLNLQLIISGT